MALPKQFRLKGKNIKEIFKNSRRFTHSLGTFFIMKNGLGNSRFGFAVPVQVSKKSNIRNKIRRMSAEWTRVNLKDIETGFDVFMVFKKNAANFTRKEFYKQLRDLFIRAGFFKY